ncbi:MAG TPA: hypothetical protein VM253_02245 [Candidatus Limnocylindrales bacterium]|nr:hypothetical protein [Candidatus Limnocylindrales bacterium]
MSEPPERAHGPTELVEDSEGGLVERLSGGTATLLLIWLIGVGAMSTLLAAWLFWWIATGDRLGAGVLFSGFGFYTGVAGAAGPCILWLTGRAQGHTLGWFLLTSAKIALVMIGMVLAVILLATLVMAGALPGAGAIVAAAIMVLLALGLSVVWALATWAADRWIARARVADR